MVKKSYLKNSMYMVFLLLFSILMMLPFFIPNKLAVQYDWSFHASRVQQLYLNIKEGHFFTFIATDTFSKIGNANFLFYPIVFLYPWAFLKLFLKPIESYLVYVWLQMFITMVIAFFVCIKYSKKNRIASLFFAIIYTIAPYHIHLTLTNYVISEGLAYMFIPIVLLGIYLLLVEQKWKTLAVGITLEFYCHIIDTVISIEVCFLLIIIWTLFTKNLNLTLIINLLKSVLLFLMLSFWQVIPFITDYWHKGLANPPFGIFQLLNPGDYVNQCLNNIPTSGNGGIGLILLITILFGWKWCRKGTYDFSIYSFGVFFSLIITSIFPWQYISHTPLAIIQFPYRYTSFAACFLSVIAAIGCTRLVYLINIKPLISVSITILALFVVFTSESCPTVFRNNNSDHNASILKHKRYGKYKTLSPKVKNPLIIIDNKTYNKQFSYGATFGETDYLPSKALTNAHSVLNRKSYLNGSTISLDQSSTANRITYKVRIPKKGKLDLPIALYKHTTLTVNGKHQVINESDRGTVSVFLEKGNYYITVGYKPLVIFYVFFTITVLTWLFLLFQKLVS